MPRIQSIEIEGFRGITEPLKIDFSQGNSSTASSVIIAGDNGVGKSSIIDAMEFCLQARIHRKPSLKRIDLPRAPSLFGDRACRVQIFFADGTSLERQILSSDENLIVSSREPHPAFRVSPFVLRRSDILEFLNTPEIQKQVVFLDFLRAATDDTLAFQDTTPEEVRTARRAAQEQRLAIAERLAKYLQVLPRDVPVDPVQFEEFVQNRVFLGLPTARRHGMLLRGGAEIVPRSGVRRAIDDMRAIQERLRDLNRAKKGKSTKVNTQAIARLFASVGDNLTKAFKAISTCSFVDRIEVSVADISDVSLSIRVVLSNGRVCAPQQVFSEANLDLLALLFFLVVLIESSHYGQAKILILDDVLQSVDATIRSAFIEYALLHLADWQVFFTAHDRLWQAQLCDILQRRGRHFVERRIVRWSPERGPEVWSDRTDLLGPLRMAMQASEPSSICAQAGRVLEAACNSLSWRLSISVKRRKDDRYTLGDLWPGVQKALRGTTVADIVERISRRLSLRNVLGAHYNEWADSVPLSEAVEFGESVLAFCSAVYCDSCREWISDSSGQGRHLECRCGAATVARSTV